MKWMRNDKVTGRWRENGGRGEEVENVVGAIPEREWRGGTTTKTTG